MRKILIATAALMGVAMIPNVASAQNRSGEGWSARHGKVGKGDYFIYRTPRIAVVNGEAVVTPRRVTTGQAELIVQLDNICRIEAKRQNPSAFKTIVITALRNAPGAFAGGVIGSRAGGFARDGSTALQYGEYNGIATVGGSIGSGITAYEMGKHNNIAGCVMALVADARRQGYLEGVVITYNTFPVYGRPLKIRDLPQAPIDVDVPAGGETDDDVGAPPPNQ